MRRLLICVIAGLLVCLIAAACGGGAHRRSSENAPTAAVHTYLADAGTFAPPRAPPATPEAAHACAKPQSGASRTQCIENVLRAESPKPVPALIRRACAVLSPTATRQLVSRMHDLLPDNTIAVVELATGGTGYPPTCADALQALDGTGASELTVQGLMADMLIDSRTPWDRRGLKVVSSTATTARVRIGDSPQTVSLIRRADVWRIASLNRS